MSDFAGLVQLEGTLNVGLQVRSGDLPTTADAFPTFRVWGTSGLLASAGGSATYRQSGAISGASNANPIVITSVGHGLSSGMRVTITGIGGNTNGNGTFTITVLSADTFSIPVAGNAPYTSGGTWVVAGFYNLAIAATSANGFQAGQTYTVHATWTISSTPYATTLVVGVV